MTKLREMQDKRWFYWLILIALFGLFFVRIIALEQDLAPWGVANYQPVDEGQYSLPVINEYNLGEVDPDGLLYTTYTPYNLRTNFVGNLVTKWGMKTFGDTYFGFRISSVIFGFLNLVLLVLNLSYLFRKYAADGSKTARFAIPGIVLFLLVDFTFFNASIIVEPSIVRMLFAQILLFVMLRTDGHGCIRYFLLAFVSMFSIGLVYFTNLFFLLGCGLLLLLQWKKEGFRKFLLYGVCFMLGMLAATMAAEVYYTQVWDSHFFTNFIRAILSFSQSTGYQITGVTNHTTILKSLIKAVAFYFSSNTFFYCVPLLVGMLAFFPGILVRIFKEKDEVAAFLFALPFSFLLQTLFSQDCITRKSNIIYPIVICLLYYMALIYKSQCKDMADHILKPSIRAIYLLVSALFIMLVMVFRLYIVSDGTTADFARWEKLLVLLFGVVPMILYLACLAWRQIGEPNWLKGREKLRRILCLIPLLVSPIMLMYHFGIDRSYTERDTMIQMGEVANGKYVIGSYVSGFTLYNDLKPITEIPEKLAILMGQDNQLLYFDYEDKTPGMRSYFDDYVFKGKDYSAYSVYEGNRAFQTCGQRRGFYLYRVKAKSKISQEWKERYESLLTEDQRLGELDSDLLCNLTTEEALLYIQAVKKQQSDHNSSISGIYNAYPDIYGNIYASESTQDVYVDIYGNIYNEIHFDIYGDVYGDIRGDVYGTIEGNVYGTVYGNVYGKITGTVSGGILRTDINK